MNKALMIPIFSINSENSRQIKSLGFRLAAGGFLAGFHTISLGYLEGLANILRRRGMMVLCSDLDIRSITASIWARNSARALI